MAFNLQGNRPKSPWTVTPIREDSPVVQATDREDAVGQILFALRLKSLPRGMDVIPCPDCPIKAKPKATAKTKSPPADPPTAADVP